MEEAGEESGPWLNPGGDDTDSQEEVARRGPAPPVLQLSSSISGEEGGAAEAEGSVEVTGGGGGNREARGLDSRDDAEASVGEAESPYLPSCPVCMNVWTADGVHRVSCIPCGHVYGRSCLEKWLLQCGKTSATCPQCGRRYKQKQIINLYAPEIAVPNNDLEKQVLSLRERNESLEKQNQELVEEIKEHKRQIMLQQNFINESNLKRQKMAEQSSHGTTDADSVASPTVDDGHSNPCKFVLQNELFLDGARVMGIDASSQIIFISGRAPGAGVEHVLTKISMCRQELQKIHLPPDTKAIRDICILPGGRAVFASLGKKLSLLRLLAGPVQVIKIVQITFMLDYRPNLLLTGMENHGVCISLACAPPSSDVLVASFRPKVELPDDGTSQVGKSQSPTPSASGKKLGCHALIRRTDDTGSFAKDQICKGSVSGLRMSKSAIIPLGRSNQHLFAYGDETLGGVRTWRLPSFQTFTDLRPHRRPILDLRFAESSAGDRYLGCISEERLQVFRVR
ncbi:hypothetical protein ABZP36_012262 [Zizania latifolia]